MKWERRCFHGYVTCGEDGCLGGETGQAKIAYLAATETDRDGTVREVYVVSIPAVTDEGRGGA